MKGILAEAILRVKDTSDTVVSDILLESGIVASLADQVQDGYMGVAPRSTHSVTPSNRRVKVRLLVLTYQGAEQGCVIYLRSRLPLP